MKNITLKSVLATTLILSVLPLSVAATPGKANEQDELCPVASGRLGRSIYYGNLKKLVKAPETQADKAEQFRLLDSPDKEQRLAAVMALALAGNIELFERLAASQDGSDMFIYASHYLNSDGTRCIDPVIETFLTDHYQEVWLQFALQGFFPKNLYRNRALFEALLSVSMPPDKLQGYPRYARALTSTNLPGIEADILVKARSLMDHTTPVQKNNLPAIHQAFSRFFAQRHYRPAVGYMNEVLQAQSWHEKKQHFRYQYAATRAIIYQALADIPSARTSQIYLKELNKLANQPWDELFSNELHHLLKHAVRTDTSADYESALIKQLTEILHTPSLPGQSGYVDRRQSKSGSPAYFDYQVRKKIYQRLADLGSEDAANALLDEMDRLRQSVIDSNRKTLTVTLLGIFQGFTPVAHMDVSRLVRQIKQLPPDQRGMYQLSIMKRYMDPATVALFYTELDDMFSHQKQQQQTYKNTTRFAAIDMFLLLNNSTVDQQLRDRLDRYYQQGALKQSRYLSYSSLLNKRLGSESRVYKTVMTDKAAEQKQRDREKAEQFQQQQRRQMQTLYQQHASAEGIRNNIQALSQFGSGAKQAGLWLVRVGPAILPYAHSALDDPASNTKLKMQLMTVLGEIGDPTSASPIINAVKIYQDNDYIYQNAFLALSRIPQTRQATAFADSILGSDHSARSQRSALVWYAQHRDMSASHWARKFSQPAVSDELRHAGLYLAARLNLEGTSERIRQELQTETDRSRIRNLLRALAEVASVEHYQAIAAETGVVDRLGRDYNTMLLACRFNHAENNEKLELAKDLISKEDPVYSREVVQFLIRQGHTDILSELAGFNNRYGLLPEMVMQASPVARIVFNEARRLGYQLDVSEGKLTLQKK